MSDRPVSGSTSTGSSSIESVPVDAGQRGAAVTTSAAGRPVLSPSRVDGAAPRDRSPQQIEHDIEATRERLAVTIDEIGDRVKPANVARRGREAALAQVRTPDGRWRTEKVAPVGAAVGALLLLVVVRKVRAARRG